MKKLMSLLLALVLVLSMAACGNTNPTEAPTDPTNEPTNAPTDPAPTDPAPTDEPTDPAATNATLDMLIMSVGEGMNMDTVTIYDDGMGGVSVDFNVNGVRKVTNMELAVLAQVEAAVQASGLLDMERAEEYGEGMNYTSVSLYYTDGSDFSVTYSGVEVPEAFTTAYNNLVASIETLLADVPQYVPEAQVIGEVDAAILSEMKEIVNNAQIVNLDMMAIMPMDLTDAESFAWSAGLSSAEGISAAAICQNMMMGGGVYTVTMVKAADPAAVAADFEASMDWLKNVCVQASNAVIATKGELVVCVMASDEQYTNTLAAMQNAGWTTVKEMANPNM